MRITGGSHRGRILVPPDDQSIRPTADKIRLAVFNILESRNAVVDAVVLDACCGTGALGLDAISRGSRHAIFMDISRDAIELARNNAKALKLEQQCTFLLADTKKTPARTTQLQATLAFLDPPYHHDLVPIMLRSLVAGDWLAPDAIIVAETERKGGLPPIAGFSPFGQKTYGDTLITLLRRR
jgi:16S rRNA (guanine966-N2)-methyltransferase